MNTMYVRGWVRQFADALERPEIMADLEAVVARSHP
jgi:hypothetical protein